MVGAEDDLGFLARVPRRHAGIELDGHQGYLVAARLAPLAAALGCDSVEALVLALRAAPTPELARSAIEALMTTETSFFRGNRGRHPCPVLRQAAVTHCENILKVHQSDRTPMYAPCAR